MLSKIWTYIKNHFLTFKFLTFGIIGVINTLIHLTVYGVFYHYLLPALFQLGSEDYLTAVISNTAAFITASVFSYFANAFFTFKPKHKSVKQFSYVMFLLLIRLGISNALVALFEYMMIVGFHADYTLYPILSYIPPFLSSALLIPIYFVLLNYVFKKTDEKN